MDEKFLTLKKILWNWIIVIKKIKGFLLKLFALELIARPFLFFNVNFADFKLTHFCFCFVCNPVSSVLMYILFSCANLLPNFFFIGIYLIFLLLTFNVKVFHSLCRLGTWNNGLPRRLQGVCMAGFGGQVCGFLLYFIGIYLILLPWIGLNGLFIYFILLFFLEDCNLFNLLLH